MSIVPGLGSLPQERAWPSLSYHLLLPGPSSDFPRGCTLDFWLQTFFLEKSTLWVLMLEMGLGSYMLYGGPVRTRGSWPRCRLAKGGKGGGLNNI